MAEQRLRALGDLPRLGEVLALHALFSEHMNDQATMVRCAQSALKLLPDKERFWRSLALYLLGMAALVAGRMTEARQLIHEARKLNPAPSQRSYARRGALIQQGYLTLGAGHLEQAALLLRQVLQCAFDPFGLFSAEMWQKFPNHSAVNVQLLRARNGLWSHTFRQEIISAHSSRLLPDPSHWLLGHAAPLSCVGAAS